MAERSIEVRMDHPQYKGDAIEAQAERVAKRLAPQLRGEGKSNAKYRDGAYTVRVYATKTKIYADVLPPGER